MNMTDKGTVLLSSLNMKLKQNKTKQKRKTTKMKAVWAVLRG